MEEKHAKVKPNEIVKAQNKKKSRKKEKIAKKKRYKGEKERRKSEARRNISRNVKANGIKFKNANISINKINISLFASLPEKKVKPIFN